MNYTTQTEHRNFSAAHDIDGGVTATISGRMSKYQSGMLTGDIRVEYKYEGFRHDLCTLRWDADMRENPIKLSHSSFHYDHPDQVYGMQRALEHAQGLMKLWSGCIFERSFVGIWENADETSWWTEVSATEWVDYVKQLNDEAQAVRAEVMWADLDPSGIIQALVRTANQRCSNVKSLRTDNSRHERHRLSKLGTGVLDSWYTKDRITWDENHQRQKVAPTINDKQRKILCDVRDVLSRDRSELGRNTCTAAIGMIKDLHDRAQKASELEAIDKRLAQARGEH